MPLCAPGNPFGVAAKVIKFRWLLKVSIWGGC